MNTAEKLNKALRLNALGSLVTSESVIFSFRTVESCKTAALKLGYGSVGRSFTGRWLLTLTTADIENKIQNLRASL